MSDDTDPVADESWLDDLAERDDLADEAEAADEADLLDLEEVEGEGDAAEAPVEQSGPVLLDTSTGCRTAGTGVDSRPRGRLSEMARRHGPGIARGRRSISAGGLQSTIAILSYKPETVDRDLKAAANRLAEPFRQQYTQLVNDVVAPGAKQQHITALATVPAAASVSATGKHAVVLVFVDQTTTIGNDAPTQSTSSVRVNLEKVDGRWLISQFDPV